MARITKTTAVGETGDHCAYFQHSIELIGRRWTGSILKIISDHALRFGEIKAAVPGLSDRLLDARLTELEAEQILSRTENHGEVRYSLTTKGIGLRPVFDELSRWAVQHADADISDRPGRRRDC